jgi:hypothetical protein
MIQKNEFEKVWLFNFALESEDGKPLGRDKANDLMEYIIQWAEENDCQVGGGYRAPKDGEFDGDKIFQL